MEQQVPNAVTDASEQTGQNRSSPSDAETAPGSPGPPPLGLYVHIPWCVKKCPYCDFNSHAANGTVPERHYIEAVLADLELETRDLGNRMLQSIFIGGGTPSLFSVEAIEALLTGIRRRLDWTGSVEITMEANPASAEAAKFSELRSIGINRLSIGIQSFDDARLEALGRVHNGRDGVAAAEAAHAAGFDSFNLDLMYGLPGQHRSSARRDVDTALALCPPHVSYYQLTLEPNTLFHRHPPALPVNEKIWAMQTASQERLARAGFVQYEVSAYAQPSFQCRHNLNYWEFGDYVGVGAGAHGKITRVQPRAVTRYWKIKHPGGYLKNAHTPARIGALNTVSKGDLPLEFMMNALRVKHGCAKTLFTDRTGLPLDALEPAYSACVADGLLIDHPSRLVCTDTGWNHLDALLERFLPSHPA